MNNLPNTAKINAQNHLVIGGCDTVELARKFGTPLYVIDEATVRERCRQYVQSFKKLHANTEIVYACKALCVSGILKIIAEEGLGFDVASGGEIYTAQKAGANPQSFYFHCNNKPKAEIQMALEIGLGTFMVDNFQEIEDLNRVAEQAGKIAQIMFRVNPGIEAHTHDYIKTGTLDSKFGIAKDQVGNAVEIAQSKKSLNLVGFHAHIGSQIFDVKPFVDEVKLLVDLAKKFGLKTISIGGGVGVAYLESDKPPAIADFAQAIYGALKGNEDIKLIAEPGRSIVCNAGVTLYTIGAVKEIKGIRKYVFIDGGMSDNPRPILYQAKYDAKVANKMDQKPVEKVTVAGRFCESGDILIKDIKLPGVEAGDVLAVLSTGAYNYSMASHYNCVGKPAMVLVNNGQAKLIVARERHEDYCR